jgi:glutathione reductase (NADPH)
MAYEYDLFIIGAGSGGVQAGRTAAKFGAQVAIAEERYLGGTCVNAGCIPKKLFAYAAQFRDDLEDATSYGWRMGALRFDWKTLVSNKDKEIERINSAYERVLKNVNVAVFRSRAAVVDPHSVEVAGRRITAKHILIAAGGWPRTPSIPGAELGFTSNDAFHLSALPKRIAIIGGGYVAAEFASIFHGLGVDTTVVHRGGRLLKTFDADLGNILGERMQARGIRILFRSHVAAVARRSALDITLTDGTVLESDAIMFATGRAPNSRGLGLENAGVTLSSSRAVMVDANYQTSVPWIHAIGDVTDRVLLTPVARAEGMAVADRLFNQGEQTLSYDNIPTAIFSNPNVATVGLSEARARSRGLNIAIFKSSFTPLKRAFTGRGEKVFMKLVVDKHSERVLGAHMVGTDAAEIIQGFAVALNCGATKRQLDATIGVHPTMAEEFVTMREAVP